MSKNKLGLLKSVGLWGSIASIIGLLFIFIPPRNTVPVSFSQKQEGVGNQQAGRDILIIEGKKEEATSLLEITKVQYRRESQMEFLLRNLGNTDLIIHEIRVFNLIPSEHRMCISPILKPTARYEFHVDRIKDGESESVSVSHYIPAHSADNILIALNSTCTHRLRFD